MLDDARDLDSPRGVPGASGVVHGLSLIGLRVAASSDVVVEVMLDAPSLRGVPFVCRLVAHVGGRSELAACPPSRACEGQHEAASSPLVEGVMLDDARDLDSAWCSG